MLLKFIKRIQKKYYDETTMMKVWICDTNYHKVGLKNNLAAPRFIKPLLSVWVPDETLLLVFDILLHSYCA